MSLSKYTRNPYHRHIVSLNRRFNRFLHNPDPSKREQLENELYDAIEAMEALESQVSKTHVMLQELMQKFLNYAKSVEETGPGIPVGSPVETHPAKKVKPSSKKKSVKKKSVDPEKETNLRKLTTLIMRRGKIKVDDAKKEIGVEKASDVRPLLEKIIETGLARKEGQTKATAYIWTGEYPEWMPKPAHYVDKSCPECGDEMTKLGNWWRCPKKGCRGKKPYEAPTRTIKRGPSTVATQSDGEIIARVLNQTANFPEMALTVEELKSQQSIDMELDKLTQLLAKQPEILVTDGVVTRRADTLVECGGQSDITRIAYATRADGSQPARRGWLNLTAEAIKTFTNLFQTTCLHGPIKDGSKFKRLEGDVWEFKSNKDKRRITCFFGTDGNIFLLTVFKKKEDKTPPAQVELAENIMAEHKARTLAARRYNPWYY